MDIMDHVFVLPLSVRPLQANYCNHYSAGWGHGGRVGQAVNPRALNIQDRSQGNKEAGCLLLASDFIDSTHICDQHNACGQRRSATVWMHNIEI